MSRARLLLADDHALVLAAITHLLEPEFAVIGSVGDGLALVAEAQRRQPDLALIDIGMPGLSGIKATRQIRTLAPEIPLVFLTRRCENSA